MLQLLLFLAMFFLPSGLQNNLPPCGERPTIAGQKIHTNANYYCLELVVSTSDQGELPYTALTVDRDGTLYATRPYAGQVLEIKDSNGDGLPDHEQIIIEGLNLPNGLFWYEDLLYISASESIYTWRDGQLKQIVDNIPSGSGLWTGNLIVHDQRLYLGVGAPCDYCEFDIPQRGAVLSFALDGSDPQIYATGLRAPSDLVFFHDQLWVSDSAPTALKEENGLDELNLLKPGADYGFPYCIGKSYTSDQLTQVKDCQTTEAPALSFQTNMTPSSLLAYQGDAFPNLKGSLLILFQGAHVQADLQGFHLAQFVYSEGSYLPDSVTIMVPDPSRIFSAEMAYDPDTPYAAIPALNIIGQQDSGFWPHHPYDLALSPEGWIYISVGGGKIVALRPRE